MKKNWNSPAYASTSPSELAYLITIEAELAELHVGLKVHL